MKRLMYPKVIIFAFLLFLIAAILIQVYEHNCSQKLILSIDNQDRQQIERLAESSWNLNSTNGFKIMERIEYTVTTPLSEACSVSDFDTVKLLIEKGASVNHVTDDIVSPLVASASNSGRMDNFDDKTYEVLKLLLEHGADPNENTEFGYPIIIMCTYFPDTEKGEAKYLDVFRMLMDHGADMNVTYKGQDVVEVSAHNHNYIALNFLLNNSLEFNEKSPQYLSIALINAVRNTSSDCGDVVKLLILKGADLSFKDSQGMTAYDYAFKNDIISDETLNLLRIKSSKTEKAK